MGQTPYWTATRNVIIVPSPLDLVIKFIFYLFYTNLFFLK